MNTPLGRGIAIFVFVVIVAIISNIFIETKPAPRYDISQIDRNDLAVISWVRNVLETRVSLESSNYDQKLQYAERFFTIDGYREFVVLIQQARVIEYLREADVKFTVLQQTSPKIVERGTKDGAFTWVLEGDAVLEIAFEANKISYPARLRYIVSRSNAADAFLGIKINSITLLPPKLDSG